MYKTAIIKQIDEKLISEWKQLWEKAENANMFNSYEWFANSLELSENKGYEIYVCYENDTLVALLPLTKYKCFGVEVLGTCNKEHLIDTAFLIEKYDRKLFKHFFEAILKKKNIYLQKVDEKAASLLHSLFPHLFISLMSVNPTIDLTQDPYQFASPSMIAQVQRIIRKNANQLNLVMQSEDLKKHFEIMMQLQKESSKHLHSMDIFTDKENKTYYESLVKNCSKFIRINILYFENKPIAYEFGYKYKNCYVGDQIAFHNDYRKLNPGKTMMYLLFAYLKKIDVKILDMGGGISSYKMSYTKDYRSLFNIYYSENIFIMIWWKMINKVRRVKQILLPKKNTRDHEFLFKTL